MIWFDFLTGERPLRDHERVEQYRCRRQLYLLDQLSNGAIAEPAEPLDFLAEDWVPPFLRRQAE